MRFVKEYDRAQHCNIAMSVTIHRNLDFVQNTIYAIDWHDVGGGFEMSSSEKPS